MRIVGLLIACAMMAGGVASGQEVVSVGKGSYAADPPPVARGEANKAMKPRFLVADDGRPIPTNKWWTQLIMSRFAKSLWAYPLKLEAGEKGVSIFFPTRWQKEGNDPASEFPLVLGGGADFKPRDSRARDWSDWLVSFRMGESDDKYLDFTIGEGMPYVWVESVGVNPTIALPGGAESRFVDRAGKPIAKSGTITADCFAIEVAGRWFGVFAPDRTSFAMGNTIAVTFSGKDRYLVVCPLPSQKDLETFYQHAFAIPRKTTVSWKYDPAKAQVATTWTIETESLKHGQTQILQGWLPHHWRETTHDLKFNSIDYLSPRGRLKCATGRSFTITYPFTGIIPNLPAPKTLPGANPYDPARMNEYLSMLAADPKYGEDTYWGGKDILRLGQAALMAQQTNDANRQAFVDHLRAAMANWLTYTPGEKAHFFMYYPTFKALVGFKTSYGSEAFNDHHFHYGYFTQAVALLVAHDPSFAKEYGEMIRLVAKEYANWDRNDDRFPFMRCVDLWAGHSWAGGFSSPGGQNQESSSEDAQSWAGLILLGQALDDSDMMAAGAMGYAMVSRAIPEYWFDIHGDTFPPEWKHKAVGMVWGGGKAFGTYFSGDAAWVYAIQWLPISPALSYLVRDPDFAKQSFDDMIAAATAQKKPTTVKGWGPALGNVIMGYVAMYDPAWTCAQLDELWNEPGDTIARNAKEMAIHYYMAHSMRSLGRYDFTAHATSPTSMVFKNQAGERTFVVWNPSTRPQTLTAYEGDKRLGTFVAAPQQLTSTRTLNP